MKHKTLTILLVVLMSIAASVASAHDFEVDGIYYNITSSNTVAVTFQGDSYDGKSCHTMTVAQASFGPFDGIGKHRAKARWGLILLCML